MSTITEALKQLKEENSFLVEGKADDIYNKYYSDMDRADFDAIWNADPTSTPDVRGKFVQWLLNRHKKGDDVLGQLPRIKKALSAYVKGKDKFNAALGTSDINGLDLNTFLTTVENTDKTKLRQYLEKTGKVVTVASSSRNDVFHPLDYIGNYEITHQGNDNRWHNWCTGYGGSSGLDYFNRYGRDYYCIMFKDDPRDKSKCYQFNVLGRDIQYFLDGTDQPHTDNPKEEFLELLLSDTDLLNAISEEGCPLRNLETVQAAREIVKMRDEGKPFEYNGDYVILLDKSYMKAMISNIEVQEGVTSVKPGVFANFSGLKRVHIPSSVEEIGVRSFQGCTSLKELELSEGLKNIRALAFYGDTSLKNVNLPDSLKVMDISAFKKCSNVVLKVRNPDGKRYLEVGGDLTEDDYRWLRNHVKQLKQ